MFLLVQIQLPANDSLLYGIKNHPVPIAKALRMVPIGQLAKSPYQLRFVRESDHPVQSGDFSFSACRDDQTDLRLLDPSGWHQIQSVCVGQGKTAQVLQRSLAIYSSFKTLPKMLCCLLPVLDGDIKIGIVKSIRQ